MLLVDADPHEYYHQCTAAAWLDAHRVLWCHVPNEGNRKVQYTAKLKRAGLKSGVPDILIFTPPPLYPQYRGCAVEMKRVKGGRLSEAQAAWLDSLSAIDWLTTVAAGADEAIGFFIECGYDGTGMVRA